MRILSLLITFAVAGGCNAPPPSSGPSSAEPLPRGSPDDAWSTARDRLVKSIEARGIADPRVLGAMRRVPRHQMVPAAYRTRSYEDRPLPIGHEQTISQPYVVAAMTEAADLAPGERVLEIGTGSGYQAAVLAELGGIEVYSIEIVEPLARRTHELLRRLGYTSLKLRIGNGYAGWSEAAPFDAIIVTAAPREVPQALIDQLAPGGHLVIPVGEREQYLQRISKDAAGAITTRNLFGVRFVPMTGSSG